MNFVDQLNRIVELNTTPARIISVVPSQTELLVDLGLIENLVGVTKFCIHPKDLRKRSTVIGGTKNLKIEKIKSLNPDFILANKEENELEQIQELAKYFPVWISDIVTLDDSIKMIRDVGKMVGKTSIAEKISNDIVNEFKLWENQKMNYLSETQNLTAAYLIWNDPIMTVGRDTFIHDMLVRCGFENLLATEFQSRYPIIDNRVLQKYNPNFLFLSSEPYPFKLQHIEAFRLLLPNTKVMLVDGEMFSWYGSRLLKIPQYFRQLFQDINS